MFWDAFHQVHSICQTTMGSYFLMEWSTSSQKNTNSNISSYIENINGCLIKCS